jgi:type III secretion system YscQ/HrcQ family protein
MNVDAPGPADSSIRPLHLRRVSDLQARLSRQLAGGLVWPLDAADLPWPSAELLLSPAAPLETSDPSAVHLQGRHGTLQWHDGSLLTLLTGVQYPADAPPEVIHDLHRLALARIPPALMECLGGPFHVLAADQSPGNGECRDSSVLQCLLTLTDINEDCHTFLLQASADTLCRWSASPGWQRHALDLRAAHALPAPLRQLSFTGGLHLGRRPIHVDRLARIGVGDALLLPAGDDALKPPLHMILGSALAKVCQHDDDSYVFQGWVPQAPPLSNPSHVKAIEKVPPIMDALKVDLDFVVGRLSMTVAELTALNSGRILPLELATPPRVRIVAHGTELGSGELIELDGRLAVEITDWGTRP